MAEKKMTPEDQLSSFYLPPPNLTKWEAFSQFIWNGERGEFLGRTGTSWAKVGLFYLIFYAGLAAFFAVMLVIFYQTLDNFEPKWKLDSSIIGDNPGLGFRPMPPEKNIESTLIWFKHGTNNREKWKHWVTELDNFLKPYDIGQQSSEAGEHMVDCNFGQPAPKGKVCRFDINSLGSNCTRENNFGYDRGSPCVLIKINRIFDWVPEVYNQAALESGKYNDVLSDEVKHLISENPDKDIAWLTCEGENPADKENIGQVLYHPRPGFPAYYYPFVNTPSYLSPIVMVQFVKPVTGVLINVECKAWAKNIEHNRMERRGSVHFELMMD